MTDKQVKEFHEEVVCPHCASNKVLSAANRDLDEGKFFCPDGCGVIDEVITGQEFCDREAWETERQSKAAEDAGLYDDPQVFAGDDR